MKPLPIEIPTEVLTSAARVLLMMREEHIETLLYIAAGKPFDERDTPRLVRMGLVVREGEGFAATDVGRALLVCLHRLTEERAQ